MSGWLPIQALLLGREVFVLTMVRIFDTLHRRIEIEIEWPGKGEIMKRARYLILGGLGLIFLAGWQAPYKKVLLPKGYKIENIRTGIAKEYNDDLTKSLCSNFTMTEAEIREYFQKADIISYHIREKGFDWLPCYVQGDLVMNGKKVPFQIEASATGWIKYSKKKTEWLGCKDACAELFNHK